MMDQPRPCPDCAGGRVDCEHCFGRGSVTCNQCGGTGSTDRPQGTFEGCERCGGSGTGTFDKIVPGLGVLHCAICDGAGGQVCETCEGTGIAGT